MLLYTMPNVSFFCIFSRVNSVDSQSYGLSQSVKKPTHTLPLTTTKVHTNPTNAFWALSQITIIFLTHSSVSIFFTQFIRIHSLASLFFHVKKFKIFSFSFSFQIQLTKSQTKNTILWIAVFQNEQFMVSKKQFDSLNFLLFFLTAKVSSRENYKIKPEIFP